MMSSQSSVHPLADVRHDRFYFDDGNLVIRSSEDVEQRTTLFRIHKGVLALNSLVFAGMFTLPDAGPSVQDTYDGVPLVTLTDSVEDLEGLLSVLYDPGALRLPRLDPDNPSRLTGIMSMANKYQVDSVRKRVVEIMEDSWPRTFAQWLRQNAELKLLQVLHRAAPSGILDGKFFEDCVPEPASAVRIAEDYDIPAILPYAYYRLAATSLKHDLNKLSVVDPVVVSSSYRGAKWEILQSRELTRVMYGREALVECLGSLQSAFADVTAVTTQYSGRCNQVAACVENGANIVSMWRNTIFRDIFFTASHNPDPLHVLERLVETMPQWKLCPLCSSFLLQSIRRRQEQLWTSLPSTFLLREHS